MRRSARLVAVLRAVDSGAPDLAMDALRGDVEFARDVVAAAQGSNSPVKRRLCGMARAVIERESCAQMDADEIAQLRAQAHAAARRMDGWLAAHPGVLQRLVKRD